MPGFFEVKQEANLKTIQITQRSNFETSKVRAKRAKGLGKPGILVGDLKICGIRLRGSNSNPTSPQGLGSNMKRQCVGNLCGKWVTFNIFQY